MICSLGLLREKNLIIVAFPYTLCFLFIVIVASMLFLVVVSHCINLGFLQLFSLLFQLHCSSIFVKLLFIIDFVCCCYIIHIFIVIYIEFVIVDYNLLLVIMLTHLIVIFLVLSILLPFNA